LLPRSSADKYTLYNTETPDSVLPCSFAYAQFVLYLSHAMRDIVEDVQNWLVSGERRIMLATVIRTFNSAPRGPGSKMAIRGDGRIAGSISGGCVEAAVIEESLRMAASEPPRILHFDTADEKAWDIGLPCGGSIDVLVEHLNAQVFQFLRDRLLENEHAVSVTITRGPKELLVEKIAFSGTTESPGNAQTTVFKRLIRAARSLTNSATIDVGEGLEAFVDVIPPRTTLVIVGGVHVGLALARLAKIVGYRTVVIDPRKTFGNPERFPDVDKLLQVWPDEAYEMMELTPETAIAVLTHDPKIDDPALAGGLRSRAFYVGAMGSARAQEQRRKRLEGLGVARADIARIHGPIGLDIGAATPEEIGLSILSEIVALTRGADSVPRKTGSASLLASSVEPR
jgi:xanthine dehydrogenase accessory factor